MVTSSADVSATDAELVLKYQADHPGTSITPARYLSATEAAERMGVTLRTMVHACRSGAVPHIRLRRQLRIPASFFDNLERGNC